MLRLNSLHHGGLPPSGTILGAKSQSVRVRGITIAKAEFTVYYLALWDKPLRGMNTRLAGKYPKDIHNALAGPFL